MKNYEFDIEKKNAFILNYKKVDNTIFIDIADGTNIMVPYTKENEKKIIDKMEHQVNNSDKFLEKINGKIARLSVIMLLSLAAATAIGCSALSNVISFSIIEQFWFFASVGVFSGCLTKIGIEESKIREIKKNKYFLKNKNIINSKVKENPNLLHNTHSKTVKQVNNTPKNEVVFTINNIDKIPFSDLEQIMKNVEFEEKFDFQYSNLEESNHKKTLK